MKGTHKGVGAGGGGGRRLGKEEVAEALPFPSCPSLLASATSALLRGCVQRGASGYIQTGRESNQSLQGSASRCWDYCHRHAHTILWVRGKHSAGAVCREFTSGVGGGNITGGTEKTCMHAHMSFPATFVVLPNGIFPTEDSLPLRRLRELPGPHRVMPDLS